MSILIITLDIFSSVTTRINVGMLELTPFFLQ